MSEKLRNISEIIKKLKNAPQNCQKVTNYIRKGLQFDPSCLKGLFNGDKRVEIRSDPAFVADRIRKLTKVVVLEKCNQQLAKPISAIIGFMKRIGKFPSACKVSNLVLLPSRTIFFLDFFPKLIDDIVDVSFQAAFPPETEGQMAYLPNRSGNLCVAISLDKIENASQVVVNAEWDQVKAFDSARWEPVIKLYEKYTGQGLFIHDYLVGQTYRYLYDVNSKPRIGFTSNPRGRGFWPGGKQASHMFSCFQSTNTAMNKSNPTWLWQLYETLALSTI